MKKAFFFAVSNNPNIDERSKKNYEYSNFVYALCLHTLQNLNEQNSTQNDDTKNDNKYDIALFKRHDMLTVDNIRDNVYKCMKEYDTFIVLIDQTDGSYNANVWFELGIIATQRDKNIILISKDIKKRFPFYIADVDVLIIDKPVYEEFYKHRELFNSLTEIEDSKKVTIFERMESDSFKQGFARLEKELTHKLIYGKNPFETQVEKAELNSLGFGNITDLFKETEIINLIKKDATVAEFINGEDEAFKALIKAVKGAKESLRTTRSSNQSIVDENPLHIQFMNTLYEKSKTLEKFDRLILNNNYLKWKDIRDMLLKGGKNTTVYVRKCSCILGFELVVIDEKISFIHFYQLNNNSGYDKTNISSKPTFEEKLNSTLKIQGEYVSKQLAALFDRFHHKDVDINNLKKTQKSPSSTILGMLDDNDYDSPPSDIACLSLPSTVRKKINTIGCAQKTKEEEVNKYLWERFNAWHTQMSRKDRVTMGVGISDLNNKYAKKILEDIEVYFPLNNEAEHNKKELEAREWFKKDLLKYDIFDDEEEIISYIEKNKSNPFVICKDEAVTIQDVEYALNTIDEKHFENIELFELKKCLAWKKINPRIYTMAKDRKTGSVLGYTNIIPVKTECYDELKEGKYPDKGIITNNILDYSNSGSYNLYFVSLAWNKDRDEVKQYLVNAFIEKLIALANDSKFVERILFRPVTDSGKKSCEFYHIKKIKDVQFTNMPEVGIFELELWPLKNFYEFKEKLYKARADSHALTLLEDLYKIYAKKDEEQKILSKYNSIKDKQEEIRNLKNPLKNKLNNRYYKVIQNEEVTEDDIKQALELDRVAYKIPDTEQFDIEKCKRWNEKTGYQVYTMIKDPETNKIVGYINAVPVNDKCYGEIKAGKYADADIDDNDIVAYEYPNKPKKYNLYFASIVVDGEKDRMRRAFELYNAFIDKLIIQTQINIIFTRMIADAVSKEGKVLCTSCKMKRIKDTKHDNSIIYEMELYPPTFSVNRKEKLKELYDVLMEKYRELGEIEE